MESSINQTPISNLVWLGVSQSADLGKIKQADHAVLVGADAEAIALLKRQLSKTDKSEASINLQQRYLSVVSGVAEFYQYNLTEFSALSKVSGLKQLFPGLKLTQTLTVDTTGIADFIGNLPLNGYHSNVLWLDIIDQALPMLQALEMNGLLNQFDQIQVQGSLESLYQDAATASDVKEFLALEGYELKAEDNSDPDLPKLSFALNELWQPLQDTYQQLEQAKQLLREDQQKAAEQQKVIEQLNVLKADQEKGFAEKTYKLEELAKSLADKDVKQAVMAKQIEAAQQLEATIAEQSKALVEKNKSLADKTNKLEELAKSLADKDAKLAEMAKQIETAKQLEATKVEKIKVELQKIKDNSVDLENRNIRLIDENKKLKEKSVINELAIDKIAEKISENHKKELNSLKSNINSNVRKNSENIIKQVESFIGVQRFLENGELTMEYHGWPISSDIALFLLTEIKNNDYDLIIEFGSGTSTQLFAQAMVNLFKDDESYIEDGASVLVSLSKDMPKRVLTFEHNKKYYDKTYMSLQRRGLHEFVDLVHAPLINCKVNGEDYLYYSCDDALKNIANLFEGRVAKILVLIDGPPASTGALARFPAITKLLDHLANHQLDLVLDDYNREDEKKITEEWKTIMESRFIDYHEESIPCEKGAWLCRIK